MTYNLGGVVNSIFVELLKSTTSTKQNILCGCVYRPPSMSLAAFNELLSDMFDKIQHENTIYVYIFGNFNVNTLQLLMTILRHIYSSVEISMQILLNGLNLVVHYCSYVLIILCA